MGLYVSYMRCPLLRQAEDIFELPRLPSSPKFMSCGGTIEDCAGIGYARESIPKTLFDEVMKLAYQQDSSTS